MINKNKINIFCIPHAGGSANYFYKFRNQLPSNVTLIPLELSGRGKRINEPFYASFTEAIDDLYITLQPFLKDIEDIPYAILGHSMGSYLAFELSLKISEENFNPPKFIFLSGSNLSNPERLSLNIDSDELLINYLHKLGGLSKEVVNDIELMNFFLPVIKADLNMLANYSLSSNKTSSNLILLNGENDRSVSEIEYEIWKEYTSKSIKTFDFPGEHFFIESNFNKILKIIKEEFF